MRRAGLFAALGACLGASLAAAPQAEYDSAASVAFPSLEIPVGVRATGMGNAYTAAGDDADSLNRNPAGLALIPGYQLGFSHNEWASSLGVRQEFLSYGQGLSGGKGLALSLNYIALGSLERRDSAGALLGNSAASLFAGTLGTAWPMLAADRLKAGLALEFISQSLYDNSQSGFAADAGLLFDVGPRLTAGLAFNHFGAGVQGYSLPSSLQAGLASQLLERSLTLALDAELPLNAAAQLKAGMEYRFSAIALRAGWRQALGGADSAIQSGLTAGAGFRVSVFRVDYSFTPYGDLSNVHRVQATVELARDFFQTRYAGPEGSSATAESFYALAQAEEKGGGTLKALVLYQRCLESYPSSLKSAPQPFYLAAGKKVDELQAQLAKGGDHSQIQKLTRDSLASADLEIKAGHFKEAIALLKRAKQVDPGSALIDAKLAEARKGLDARLQSFRDAAHFAVGENNLAMGVENYRKLLSVDSSDAEALAYLNKHRAEIKALLQATDRKAIYFYVAGKLEEAIKVWSDGEAMDYFGDVDFKRNLDKARKQLELRDKK